MGNIFLITSLSLDHDTINPELTKIVTKITNEQLNLNQLVNTQYPTLLNICKNQTKIYLANYSIPSSFSVPCDTIEKNPEEIINYTIHQIIEESYYKDYDCKFSECTKSSPLYIISEANRNNLKSKFNKTLIFSIILIIIIFLLVEKKKNTLTVTGIILILAALPLTKIDFPIKLFTKTLGIVAKTNFINNDISNLILLMFSKTQTVFNVNIMLGTMLIVLGIGLGFLKLLTKGKEKKFTKREVEEIVDKKLSKNPTTDFFSKLFAKKPSEKKA